MFTFFWMWAFFLIAGTEETSTPGEITSTLTESTTAAITTTPSPDSTCQLPASLIGQWNDVTRNATVTFTSTQMLGWNVTVAGERNKHVSQTCIKNTGNVYVFEGDEQYSGFMTSKSYYICMKLTQVSQNLFYYYLLADLSFSEKIFTPDTVFNPATKVTCDYCQYTREIPDTDFNLLQKLGTSETLISTPSPCLPCEETCHVTPTQQTSTTETSPTDVVTTQTTTMEPETTTEIREIDNSQNCTFPCGWINRDFKLTGDDGTTGFWNVSETTIVQQLGSSTMEYDCFQIVGRFLIVTTINNEDSLLCFTVEINNADSFTAITSYGGARIDFTNECNVCHRPNGILMKLSENQTGPECNIPVGCTPDPIYAINPSVCDNNGNIEDDCKETATPPPPLPPRHCKHRSP